MGKLIVIDGLDGSGKSTQMGLLTDYCQTKGIPVRIVKFPDYESRSSELVKMYLAGEISQDPDEINAYAAASFYACDRYISYTLDWGREYQDGALILCDRYVTSNAIHQMVKLQKDQWDDFLHWLDDYEYEKLRLPRPDQVIYLDMPPAVSKVLLSRRYGGDESKRDIHEKDFAYLLHCREAALYAAEKQGWQVVSCAQGDAPRKIEDIFSQIGTLVDLT